MIKIDHERLFIGERRRQMARAKVGDLVKVHYTEFLKDGTVLDSSAGKDPLEFTLGDGMLIPGFENAVVGMNEGDSKSFSIPPEQAYGQYREELILTLNKSQIPSHIDPQIGMVLQVRSVGGAVNHFIITDITDDMITLDGNHPLAGKELNFEVELVKIT
ncbi:MAG: FKBP-type peptidyl-prolyl cis-trans isomerase [bacterium]